jgi:hypothetical protein
LQGNKDSWHHIVDGDVAGQKGIAPGLFGRLTISNEDVMGNIVVGLTMFIQYLMRNHDKPSKFPGYPFTDKPNYHEK